MSQHSNPIQEEMVLDHLIRHGPITPLQALQLYGIFRLAARIFRLRQDGHKIITNRLRTNTGKTVGEYVLLQQARDARSNLEMP
jgi:helix-turn-helix protein